MYKSPMQLDRPLFVRIPFTAGGHDWEVGDRFPWLEIGAGQDRVQILYDQGYLFHSEELTVEMNVGDGLEVLELEALKQIVDDYNKRVKAVAQTQTQFEQRKCKGSLIRTKQMGLIRNWRRIHLDWLTKAEEAKKNK